MSPPHLEGWEGNWPFNSPASSAEPHIKPYWLGTVRYSSNKCWHAICWQLHPGYQKILGLYSSTRINVISIGNNTQIIYSVFSVWCPFYTAVVVTATERTVARNKAGSDFSVMDHKQCFVKKIKYHGNNLFCYIKCYQPHVVSLQTFAFVVVLLQTTLRPCLHNNVSGENAKL